MAHRKQIPQPLTCAQCPTVFMSTRKGQLYCSSACNTRAWRQRQPAPAPPATGVAVPSPEAPVAAGPVTLATNVTNVGTIALGTAAGNLLTELGKWLFTPTAAPVPLPATFPTWPPAELLAAAQPPQHLTDPTWDGPLWLTPTLYHGHTLHLHVHAELPYVLWQAPNGDWRLLTTPAELRQVAALRPMGEAMRAMQRKYGVPGESPAIGTLLTRPPQQLG